MKYRKRGRRFLNVPESGCLGAVSWSVEVNPPWEDSKTKKDCMWADLHVNDDAKGHYIERKAHMLPVYRMRDELNKFIEACEQALKDIE